MNIEKESQRIVRMPSKERKARQFCIFRFLKEECALWQFPDRDLFKVAKKYVEYWDGTYAWLVEYARVMLDDLYILTQCDCPECGGMTWQIVDAEMVE